VLAAPLPEDVELLPSVEQLGDRCTVDGNPEGIEDPPSPGDDGYLEWLEREYDAGRVDGEQAAELLHQHDQAVKARRQDHE